MAEKPSGMRLASIPSNSNGALLVLMQEATFVLLLKVSLIHL